MTVFQIKLIAIITMTIDHIGLFFFPQNIELRLIGRLAFPLFAWLIANGAKHTKDENKYALRLLLFAFISQIPYSLATREINPDYFKLNIFFTLFLGLAAIILINKTKNLITKIILIIFLSVFASLINSSYGAIGVLSIVAFYLFFGDLKKMILSQVLIFAILYPLFSITHAFIFQKTIASSDFLIYQPFSLAALFVIAAYKNRQGLKWQYFFYWYYPVHLLVIYMVLNRI